jgi:hypothetical protein
MLLRGDLRRAQKVVPAQPVDATLSNQLIHKMLKLKNRSVWLMWPNLARVRFRLI